MRDIRPPAREIETAFTVDNMFTQPDTRRIGPYRAENPRLLVGTADHPEAGLLSMRRTMQQLLANYNVTTIAARAEALSSEGAIWQARLTDGSIVSAHRIILAAGVLGTAMLLIRSFPEVSSVRLRDHAPWMLYTRGLEQLVPTTRPGKKPNLNARASSAT